MMLETRMTLFLTNDEKKVLLDSIELIQKLYNTKNGKILEEHYEELIRDSPNEEKTAFRNAASVLFYLAYLDDQITQKEI